MQLQPCGALAAGAGREADLCWPPPLAGFPWLSEFECGDVGGSLALSALPSQVPHLPT